MMPAQQVRDQRQIKSMRSNARFQNRVEHGLIGLADNDGLLVGQCKA